MPEKITISKDADWSKLTDQSIETVVDPMVYRCGQLFLQGAKKNPDRGRTWDLLDWNIYSISTFFDSIILYDKLPVFNYSDTFDSTLNLGELIPAAIYNKEQIFFDVDVQFEAYRQIKDATLGELQTIYKGEKKVSEKLVSGILKELSWADYKWVPNLEYLENEIKGEKELKLARFLLGGLIFGKYAEKIGGEHFLQPKRSTLLLNLSLNRDFGKFDLFDKLKEYSNILQNEEIPWRPTFLPYLLSKGDNIKSLFTEAIRLRKTGEVKDYRQWWKEITREWQKGKISINKRKEVESIKKKIEKKIGISSAESQFEIKANLVAPVTGEFPVSAEINVMPYLKTIWGYTVNSLPGKRHRKLLTRLLLKDHEYRNIKEGVRKVWQAS